MFKQIKLFIVVALCMTVPSWGVHAAAPEMPAFLLNVQGSITTEQQAFLLENWDLTEISDDLPATVDSHMMQTLFPDEGIIPIDVTIELDNLSDEELEIALQDELFLGQDSSFWNRTRIVLGGFIVIAGILMILMLFVAGGGGSGAGGGSGSGGGGDSNNPPIIGGGPIGGDGGEGGQCETITCFEGGGAGGQGSIPMNPEPSTLLLLGLGLLLPLLRRKV